MTGFASTQKVFQSKRFSIEVKTVNNRYLEFKFKAPLEYLHLEHMVLKEVKQFLFRGSVEVLFFEKRLSLDKTEYPKLDQEFAEYCFRNLKFLKKKFSIQGDIHLNHLLSLMNTWSNPLRGMREHASQKDWKVIQNLLKQSLKKVNLVREKEGKELKKSVLENLYQFEKEIQKIIEKKELLKEHHSSRLQEKMAAFLKNKSLDENRLSQEVGYLMQRSDIGEELDRLQSHIKQFQSFLKQNNPIGKSLDFLIQEMNREINTIGSKIQDVEISPGIILCKSLLEKIREQIQNVE